MNNEPSKQVNPVIAALQTQSAARALAQFDVALKSGAVTRSATVTAVSRQVRVLP